MPNRRIHMQRNPGSDTDENSNPGSFPAGAVSLKKRLLARGSYFVRQLDGTTHDANQWLAPADASANDKIRPNS